MSGNEDDVNDERKHLDPGLTLMSCLKENQLLQMKRDLFKARVSFNSVWQQRICHASQFCMAIVDILTGVGRDELYPPLDAMWFRRSVMCPDISLDPI